MRERVTIQEAARRLGVSDSAIRKRMQRGTLQHAKDGGRVYVWLDEEPDTVHTPVPAVVEDLRETVRDLRERLDREQEANRENRRIIAGLIERIPELDAAPEASPESREDAPESPEPRSESLTPTEPAGEPESSARRPWWLRWLGG